eukprot:6473949-Amphidinium_carterae.1
MSLKHGSLWVPTRRFTLAQGVEEYEVTNANGEKVLDYRPKVRCIDDFSESGINGTAILRERINPEGVDSIIAMARTWGVMLNGTSVSLKLDGGEIKTGTVHQSMLRDGRIPFSGMCRDLVKAYRQVPLRVSQQHLSIFAQWCKERSCVVFYEQRAQSFGAAAAVNNFYRLAVALNALFTSVLKVPTSQYFDDYAFVLPAAAMECFGGYFDKFAELLGWRFSEKSDP